MREFTEKGRRFYLLDGLRGVAAVIVVLGHTPDIWIAGKPSHFYLAVDLFFVLSGFVIAHAYEERLTTGLTVSHFMLARYIRLYPLYLCGTLVGIAGAIIAYAHGKGGLSLWELSTSIPAALFLLPAPTDGMMLLNPPAWSLLFELLMNFCYALFLIRLSTRSLLLLVLILAVSLAVIDLHLHSLHTGMTWSTSFYGFVRLSYSYCVGLILFKTVKVSQLKVSWAVLVPFLIVPVVIGHDMRAEVTELLAVFVCFPMIVAAGIVFDCPSSRPLELLGSASYGIYIISVPAITVSSRVLHAARLDETYLHPWFGYAVVIALIAIAVALRGLDLRARRFMSTTLPHWLRPNLVARLP